MDWGQPKASHRVFKDLPLLTEKAIVMLRNEQLRLHACLTPISPLIAGIMLAKLWGRYPTQVKSKDLVKSLIHEDLVDIEVYPEQLVEFACKAWRNNPENKWAPQSVGNLMECVKGKMRLLRKEQERVDILIKRSE